MTIYRCREVPEWEDNPDPSIIKCEPTWYEFEIYDDHWQSSKDPTWAAEACAEKLYDDDPQPDYFPMVILVEGHGKFKVSIDFDPCFEAEKI